MSLRNRRINDNLVKVSGISLVPDVSHIQRDIQVLLCVPSMRIPSGAVLWMMHNLWFKIMDFLFWLEGNIVNLMTKVYGITRLISCYLCESLVCV